MDLVLELMLRRLIELVDTAAGDIELPAVIVLPIAVPGPTRVMSSFSSRDSSAGIQYLRMASPILLADPRRYSRSASPRARVPRHSAPEPPAVEDRLRRVP
jgi:hypothetical protein